MNKAKSLVSATFVGNAKFSYVMQGLKMGLGFAWMTAVISVTSLEVFGMIALLTSLTGVVGNLLTFRTNEAVVKFVKRGEIEDSPGLCRLTLELGALLDVLTATALFAVIYFGAGLVATEFLKSGSAEVVVKSYAWVPMMTYLRGTAIGLMTAHENFRTIYSLAVVEQAMRLLLLAACIILGFAVSLESIVWMILAPAVIITSAIILHPMLTYYRRVSSAARPMGEFRTYFRFAFSTFISSSLKSTNRNVDVMILGYLTGPDSVGIYSLFRRFLRPLAVAASPFTEQIYPIFVHAVESGNRRSIRHTIAQSSASLLKWSLLLLVAVALLAAVYWQYMDFLFEADWILAFLFLSASALVSQQLWWARGFALAHDPDISIVANVLSSVFVVSFVFVFTAYFELAGAAFGVLLSGLLMAAFWWGVLRRFSPDK